MSICSYPIFFFLLLFPLFPPLYLSFLSCYAPHRRGPPTYAPHKSRCRLRSRQARVVAVLRPALPMPSPIFHPVSHLIRVAGHLHSLPRPPAHPHHSHHLPGTQEDKDGILTPWTGWSRGEPPFSTLAPSIIITQPISRAPVVKPLKMIFW